MQLGDVLLGVLLAAVDCGVQEVELRAELLFELVTVGNIHEDIVLAAEVELGVEDSVKEISLAIIIPSRDVKQIEGRIRRTDVVIKVGFDCRSRQLCLRLQVVVDQIREEHLKQMRTIYYAHRGERFVDLDLFKHFEDQQSNHENSCQSEQSNCESAVIHL